MSGHYAMSTRGLRLGEPRKRSERKKSYETAGVGEVRRVIIHTCVFQALRLAIR